MQGVGFLNESDGAVLQDLLDPLILLEAGAQQDLDVRIQDLELQVGIMSGEDRHDHVEQDDVDGGGLLLEEFHAFPAVGGGVASGVGVADGIGVMVGVGGWAGSYSYAPMS